MDAQITPASVSITFNYTSAYVNELVQAVATNVGNLEQEVLKREYGEKLAANLGSAVLHGSIIVGREYRVAMPENRELYPVRLLVNGHILKEENSTDADKVALDLTEEGRDLHRKHFPLPTDFPHN